MSLVTSANSEILTEKRVGEFGEREKSEEEENGEAKESIAMPFSGHPMLGQRPQQKPPGARCTKKTLTNPYTNLDPPRFRSVN